MEEIRVTCHAADVLPVDSLVEFQGNLKTISRENLDKLKRSILRHGFSAPIFVWRGADNHILDGHQRLRALLEFRQEGYDLPLLPVVYIDADSEEHAKEKLLYITSQYGTFSLDGYTEFASGFSFDISDVRFSTGEMPIPEDIGIIFDGEAAASLSGGHGVGKSFSVWIYDLKLVSGDEALYDEARRVIAEISKRDAEDNDDIIRAMLRAADEVLDSK